MQDCADGYQNSLRLAPLHCAEPNCSGRMVRWGQDSHGHAVYQCTVCETKRGEGSLMTSYRELKLRD